MKLPYLKSSSKMLSVKGGFKGIGENQLADSINLNCSDVCHTRNPREAAFLYDTPPDQIIRCDNTLFLRYKNTLKAIIMDYDGSLKERSHIYELSNLPAGTDRNVILWNDKFFVFPDKIQIGIDVWHPFGANNFLSVALPFTNAHTLFYTSDTTSSKFCDDSQMLKVGMKLCLSNDNLTEYTIKIIETQTTLSDDGLSVIEVGKRVTLDKNVPRYNSLPTGTTVEYCNPSNRPILNDLSVGISHDISFSGNRMIITSLVEPFVVPLSDFFKIGQRVEISGSSVESNNKIAKITDIKDGTLYFDEGFIATNEARGTKITVTPVIPDFSHLLITEDRLFGVDNDEKKLHISALNNPFLFYDNIVEDKDAWSMNLNSPCTGITLWKDSIICFTDSGGFRILGYHAKNFGVRQLSLTGIKKECENSLCRVGDTLYYCSDKGVMKYSGGSDNTVFHPSLQIKDVKKSTTDGVFVYMLTNDRMWIYDTVTSLCWSEDNKNILDVFNFEGETFIALDQAIYLVNGKGDIQVDWSFKLPFLPNDKYQKIIPLYFNLIYNQTSDCVINLQYKPFGENLWKNLGSYHLKDEGNLKIQLPKGYCNGFEIKASGYGMFRPENWFVSYRNAK